MIASAVVPSAMTNQQRTACCSKKVDGSLHKFLRESQSGTDSDPDQPRRVLRPSAIATVDSYTKHLGPETGKIYFIRQF